MSAEALAESLGGVDDRILNYTKTKIYYTGLKDIDNDKPLERKKVIPPKDHPWRKKFNRRI